MSMIIQDIPNDLEAEQAVLGAIIYDNETINKIGDILKPTSFYHIGHQYIYRAILELIDLKQPVDEILLGSQLKSLNQLEEVGDYSYLLTLVDCVPSSDNIIHYAEIIKEKSLLRQIIAATTDIAKKSRDPEQKAVELIYDLNSRIENINYFSGDDTEELKAIFPSVFEKLEDLEKLQNNNITVTGIPSGLIDLDKITTGSQKSSFDIIGARPSLGKTALALDMIRHGIFTKGYDLLISLETSKEKLGLRLLSQAGKVESIKFRNGNLNDNDWDNLARAVDDLSDLKLLINDSTFSLNGIVSLIKQKHKQYGLKRVIIDFLQLINGDKKKIREQEIAEISRTFKLLSKELDINITALCQLNRELEKRSNKEPIMSDLRESGSLEQDADLIIFIYRDEVYNDETEESGTAKLIVAKQKDGPTGDVKLAFIGKYTSFENFSNRED